MYKSSALALAAVFAISGAGIAATKIYGISLNGQSEDTPDTGDSLLYTIDPYTGSGTLVGELSHDITSFAIDPVTGKMYGATASWGGPFYGLVEIDPSTGRSSELTAFQGVFGPITGLGFGSAGALYGWDGSAADDLVTIDILSGEVTQIDDTGIEFTNPLLVSDEVGGLILKQGGSVFGVNLSSNSTSVPATVPSSSSGGGSADASIAAGTSASVSSGSGGGSGAGANIGAETSATVPEKTEGEEEPAVQVVELDVGPSSFLETDIADLADVEVAYSEPQIAPVPIPMGLPLLLTGLAGLGWMASKRRAT